MLRHPFGARQMAVERPSGAIGLILRIGVQHYSCDVAPVSNNRIRVEEAQIGDDVLLVVNGQYGIGGRGIGDIGIKRRLLHGLSRNRLLIEPLCFGLLGILMTRTSGVRFAPESGHRALQSACLFRANNRPTSARNNGMPNYAISEFARDIGRSKIVAGRPVIDAMSSKVFPQTMSGSQPRNDPTP